MRDVQRVKHRALQVAPGVAIVLSCALSSLVAATSPCQPNASFSLKTVDENGRQIQAIEEMSLVFNNQDCDQVPRAGASFRFTAGSLSVQSVLPKMQEAFPGQSSFYVWLTVDASAANISDLLPFPSAGTLEVEGNTYDVNITGDYQRGEVFKHDFSLGPASNARSEVSATEPEPSSALRAKYNFDYSTLLGNTSSPVLSATLKVDTTDKASPAFVDDNSFALTIGHGHLNAGKLIRNLRYGGDLTYSRAFHSRTATFDAEAAVGFRVPLIPALNLFRKAPGKFLSPPLSIDLSYGYRNRSAPQTDDKNGAVFKGSARYDLYLFDRYRLDLQYQVTNSHYHDADPLQPATQRLYRASLSYLANESGTFTILTSYEDGSIGPVVEKFKQYFIGIGLSRF